MGRDDGRRARDGHAGGTAGSSRVRLATSVANADEPRVLQGDKGRVIPAGAEEGKNKGSTVRTPRVAGRSHIRVISGGTARARKGKKGRRRRGLSSLL
ncbi:unnamed protein product [Closterium sp. NIES-65]|nr:unnamed protein product [Closterium sp. NIES-65]